MGERGQKDLQTILATASYLKQDRKVKGVREQYLQTSRMNFDLPPLLIWNQLDLKLSLEDLCPSFNLSGDMEVDDGNSFSYIVVVSFPSIFGQQVVKTQFMPYDALPTFQNPQNLCRDLTTVLEENKRKYGGGKNLSAANTLLEVSDIELASSKMKMQFVNQIETALFGEFSNSQRDFPKVRLKKV